MTSLMGIDWLSINEHPTILGGALETCSATHDRCAQRGTPKLPKSGRCRPNKPILLSHNTIERIHSTETSIQSKFHARHFDHCRPDRQFDNSAAKGYNRAVPTNP